MPNIKSAAKRMRQSIGRTATNKSKKSRINTARRGLEEAITVGDKAKAEVALKELASALDKGAKGGVITSNKADRTKSRATKALSKM